MAYRTPPFVSSNFYHIYNRGVEKRQIFSTDRDYQRFLQTLYYYQFGGPKPRFSYKDHFRRKDFDKNLKIVEIVTYCLMLNHFHLLIRQLKDDGIKEFMQKIGNSYTKYYNTKHKRVGPLFQGTFKAVLIETDMQLMHVSRYIHLNPYVSDLATDVENYQYSSYRNFVGLENDLLCVKEPVLDLFNDKEDYQKFVIGHSDYAKELEIMKHLLIEEE